MVKNKVIVIGGIPGVGKTSIAGHLARQLDIDIMLSTDYLREFLRNAAEGRRTQEVFSTSVYDAWKNFGERTRENILRGYRAQGKLISRGINAVIERAHRDGEGLIIETLYFIPDQLPALTIPGTVPLYIQVSDPQRHSQMLLERARYTHPGQPGDRLAAQADAYRFMAEDSLQGCASHGIRVFDNLDYNRTRDEITAFVRQSIQPRTLGSANKP